MPRQIREYAESPSPPPRNQRPPPPPHVPEGERYPVSSDMIKKKRWNGAHGESDHSPPYIPTGQHYNRQGVNETYEAQDGQMPAGMISSNAKHYGQEILDDTPVDTFVTKMREVLNLHVQQISLLNKENDQLKERLNVVLQATWDFTNEERHGHVHKPGACDLVLMTQQQKEATWMVPADFENPMKRSTEDAPMDFPLRDAWQRSEEDAGSEDEKESERKPSKKLGHEDIKFEADSVASDVEVTVGEGNPFITHPSSTKRLAWDVVAMFLLIYDVIMVPILAFGPDESAFTVFMDWCTLIFWTSDMVASCITGFNTKGQTILEPREILKNYAKTWFPLDCIIVIPDWIQTIATLAADGKSSSGGFTRFLRTVRVARALRLLRLAKLKRILTLLKDNIQSELVFKAFNLVQIVVMLVTMNHCISAIWYSIGKSWDKNWIEDARMQDEDLPFRYFTSLQWTMSFFTLGSIRVEPQNSFERLFTVFMMAIGMVFFTVFTAHVTVALLQARDNRKDTSTQLWILRRYLRQQKVPKFLEYRVLRYAEYACKDQKTNIPEQNVTVLEQLSDGLATELQFEAHYSAVCQHPLFELAKSISYKTVFTLTNNVMTHRALEAKETLFKRNTWAQHMFFVASGQLYYGQSSQQTYLLGFGDWACEPTLWVRWMTKGISKAARVACELIVVDSRLFGELIKTDAELLEMMQTYAAAFASYLNNIDSEQVMDIWPDSSISLANKFLEGCKKPLLTKRSISSFGKR